MAKGAATVETLGGLHSLLAKVFTKTLEKYLKELEVLDKLADGEEFEDELLVAMLAEMKEPNPAMLSALSKFLKDNDIGMDSDAVEELNSTERRLAESRARRAASGMKLELDPHVESA